MKTELRENRFACKENRILFRRNIKQMFYLISKREFTSNLKDFAIKDLLIKDSVIKNLLIKDLLNLVSLDMVIDHNGQGFI